jgi:hypothetical protein
VHRMKLLAIIIMTLFALPSLHADWTEPARITNDLALRIPSAVIVGETLHVVANGASSIYYLSSFDNGATWTEPIVPPDTFYGSEYSDIAANDDYIHIVFKAYFLHQSEQIFHMSSIDGGRSWSEPHQVFNHSGTAFFKYPHLATNGDTLFLSCVRYPYLLVFRSFDNGVTWQDSIAVENGPIVIDTWPSIIFSQNRLHLIYQLNIVGDSLGIEIYHRSSNNNGLTWSDRCPLSEPEPSPNIAHSQRPSAYADWNGNIIAAWFDYKYGSYCGFTGDILARISTDNGDSWLPESRLTYTQSGSGSSCIIYDNKIYVVWMDYFPFGCECSKIMYSESEDWGLSWEDPVVISGSTESIELSPKLVQNGDQFSPIFHCIIKKYYTSTRSDLYYFRSEEFTSVRFDNDYILFNDFELSVYPNPFNSSTNIMFKNFTGGDLKINIFNLNGQRVKSFNIKGQKEGAFIWDATDEQHETISSGIYFVSAVSKSAKKLIRLIYLK